MKELTNHSNWKKRLRKLFWNHLPQWEMKRMARTTFITIMTLMMIMMRMKRNLLMPHRSSRVRQPTELYGQLVNAISADESDEPTSYKEAMEGPESEKWLEAMKSEIDS